MSEKTIQETVFREGIELWDAQSCPHVTPEIIDRLNNLLDFVRPGELREYLLELYHQFIIHEHENLPCNFKDVADGMQILFDFLKFAQEELSEKRSLSAQSESSDT